MTLSPFPKTKQDFQGLLCIGVLDVALLIFFALRGDRNTSIVFALITIYVAVGIVYYLVQNRGRGPSQPSAS
jgi:hypothetical protein